jgi:hypothetical protein
LIVRIATEGQYELQGGDEEKLNQLDNDAVAACQDTANEEQFREIFDRMLDFVRSNGRAIPDEELAASDVILPPPGTTLEEARAEFTGEGLIPG